jgi:methionyl-tRNA formyltransferase
MRIVFMGTPESAVPSLRRLIDDGHELVAVWTQPDRLAGRGQEKMKEPPVKEFALAHKLELEQPRKIRTEQSYDLFESYDADVAVVVAYGRILPNEFLNAPKHGCINVHFSLLPKYRGAAPVNWAIVNGETETGVTTMRIVQELDAGPILLQRATKIATDETAAKLLSRLADSGADLIGETISNLDRIESKPQIDSEATFAPILKREDGLIDWSMDAFAIERRVRGFQPWPTAYTTFRSRRLKVWTAAPEWIEQLQFPPGQIIEAGRDRLIVACGDGTALRVLELQLQDSRRMSARDFLNGTQLRAGVKLGEELR